MEKCREYLKNEFPNIDDNFKGYLEDVLKNGADDFKDTEDVYEAIGEMLMEVSQDKTEEDIRIICKKILNHLKNQIDPLNENGKTSKTLNAPVQLGSIMTNDQNMDSIWMLQRDYTLKVDLRKLEKAEAKLLRKQEKRTKESTCNEPITAELDSATASQVTNKNESKLETKGVHQRDIRLENFDIAYGNRVLLSNADMTLAFGRRYGLVGRNGLGKTTLLRLISNGQLRIPSHISVLHVEQEVVGDETIALDSVLECDTVRDTLLKRERQLSRALYSGSTDPKLSEELTNVYAQLQHIEADKAPAKASVILNGLGFTKTMQRQATKLFSGGWRMRLALARALFSKPDLLLLDEPTNMLDIKAIIWLENYLKKWPTTLLVVSHNRNFLDSVPTDILYLHSQRIDSFRGNYEQFVRTKAEKLKNQQREYEAQQQHRAHVQIFIDKYRYNHNTAASVQSKIKLLEKLPVLKPVEKEVRVTFKFPKVEPLLPPILQLDDISFKYNDEKQIFQGLSLSANLESRICMVGENGAGKTTLLKIIMGVHSPTSGLCHAHPNLKFGYFSQHHVDQLNMNVNSVQLLRTAYPGKSIQEYRHYLGSFGISGNLALQSVGSLSGGQKSRVALARMCMGMPNFLILDEPTNHLDIESIEALGKAINKYKGGVILVSHDERLIRMVCKELWVCGNGKVRSIEGGFEAYRKMVEKELEA